MKITNLDFNMLLFFLIIIIVFLFVLLIIQQIYFHKKIKFARQDAIKRSRAVINGQLNEQLSPFFPDFPCSPSDAHFLGKPIDFIAFSGLSEKDSVDEILFIEVKTGSSNLSNRERAIKNAVQEGRIRYVEYRLC